MRQSLVIVLTACLSAACSTSKREAIDHHRGDVMTVSGIERVSGEGPYLSGAVETFQLQHEGREPQVVWSASSGSLNASGTQATWKLPAPGIATLSATFKDSDGVEKTLSWDFQIVSAEDSFAVARQALLAAPTSVGDAGTTDITGSVCEIAYDSTNKIHLAFRNDTHPSLWYGVWNGTSWAIELVDGMGFNNGGMVGTRIAMAIDASNNPHFAYFYEAASGGLQVRYATKSGSTWTRERVDTSYGAWNGNEYALTLALNPAQSYRPTILYTHYVSNVRTIAAVRTGANTWTENLLNVSGTHQYLQGEALYDSAGTLYFPSDSYLASWDGTTIAYVGIGGVGVDFSNLAWAGAGQLVGRTNTGLVHVTLASPLSSSTRVHSRAEVGGSEFGDLAFSTRPHLVHKHGSNLELVSTSAQGYFTYTQLGSLGINSQPSVAVSSSGTVSLCYQTPSGQVMFQ